MVFLIAWLFPRGLYSRLVGEPDLMFLDPQTLLFFLLCVTGFWVGLLLIGFLFPSPPLLDIRYQASHLKGLSLMAPLIVTTLLTCVVSAELLRQTPNLLALLLSQQGSAVKNSLADAKVGVLGWGPNLQQPFLWWTYWQLQMHPKDVWPRRFGKTLCWTIFIFGLLSLVGLSILKVSRAAIMPLFGGLAVVYLMGKITRREVNTAGIIRYLLLLLAAVMFVFISFALMRGTADLSAGLSTFVGYTMASYNRLTALLQGTMHYPYGGHGVYVFPFFNSNHLVNAIFPANEIFRWPDYFELWHSEFLAPQLAGLNDYLIWSGTFGYLFSDCGWFTPLILVFYGAIYGLAWRQIKSGGAFGLAVYPWLAFCALVWFSGNLAFNSAFTFCVAAGLLLMAYEKLLA